MKPVALISTFRAGVASPVTSTRVQQGKSPVKNSLRARQTSCLSSMRVTNTLSWMMSSMTAPQASTRCRIFWKVRRDWSYMLPSPSTPPDRSWAVMPEMKNWPLWTLQLVQVWGGAGLISGAWMLFMVGKSPWMDTRFQATASAWVEGCAAANGGSDSQRCAMAASRG